jgi:hypothetical protein
MFAAIADLEYTSVSTAPASRQASLDLKEAKVLLDELVA